MCCFYVLVSKRPFFTFQDKITSSLFHGSHLSTHLSANMIFWLLVCLIDVILSCLKEYNKSQRVIAIDDKYADLLVKQSLCYIIIYVLKDKEIAK